MRSPGGEREQAGDGPQTSPACELCGGTGWLQIEDPFCGGWLDARCPECEEDPLEHP